MENSLLPLKKPSPFSRACLTTYLFLVMYASWYPFTNWQFENLAAYVRVLQEWPRYRTMFDAGVNVSGYIPLGLLIVFSLYPYVSRTWSVIVATIACFIFSFALETVQYLLPSRVTSLLDILTNSAGGFLGAVLGAMLIPMVLEKGRLQLLARRWLERESSREILVISMWPVAQLFPQAYLFGLGQILPVISLWCEEYLDITIDLSSFLRHGFELSPEEYLLSETIITACGVSGALLICLSLLNKNAPKFRLACLLLIGALVIKTLANAVMFQPENAFLWLTPSARGGLLIGILMLYGFSFAPHRAQQRLAILLITISLLLVNLIPTNPYFINSTQTLMQGKMLNFYGAAQFLALAWPFVALWYLYKGLIYDTVMKR